MISGLINVVLELIIIVYLICIHARESQNKLLIVKNKHLNYSSDEEVSQHQFEYDQGKY